MELDPNESSPFLTVDQLRRLAGISPSFAYQLIRSGQLRAVRLGRRGAIRIHRQELRRFLESRSLKRDAA